MSELPNFSDEQDERLVLDERDLAFQEAAYWEIEREDAPDPVYEAYCAEMRLDALRRIGMGIARHQGEIRDAKDSQKCRFAINLNTDQYARAQSAANPRSDPAYRRPD